MCGGRGGGAAQINDYLAPARPTLSKPIISITGRVANPPCYSPCRSLLLSFASKVGISCVFRQISYLHMFWEFGVEFRFCRFHHQHKLQSLNAESWLVNTFMLLMGRVYCMHFQNYCRPIFQVFELFMFIIF